MWKERKIGRSTYTCIMLETYNAKSKNKTSTLFITLSNKKRADNIQLEMK